ncbi:TRAPP II complex [Crepidotus variabilis]|uniref:TRAPP II complex n=1 Tax=Crepidotus variabilis TaxID=179855 RepID=A0A9P6EQ32_9AGAR|nr:TRAPP II complex [Crepidotus variabilis]
MDTHSFASLAHVRILLLPVGLIPQSLFESYASEIRTYTSLKLAEIPADTRDGKAARFLPNPMSTGYLHLSFPTHPPAQSQGPLSLLRPSIFPLAVVGIAACSQGDNLRSLHHQFNSNLEDIFPAGSTFPLVRNCFAFEETEGTVNLDTGESLPGLTIVPCIAKRKLHLGTLLGVLCSQILVEFGTLTQALESPVGNEYLNASLMPLPPPLSELPSPLNRGDSIPNISSHNSQPEVTRSSFTLGAAPTLKRMSTAPSTAPSRSNTLNVTVPSKKRLSTYGTSSSHGRLYKMLGDFFLLSGRSEDALICRAETRYNEAALVFRSANDPLWYASTCEGMATCSIIEAWSAGHGLNNSTTAVKEPWHDVSDRLTQAINLYQRTAAPESEPTHALFVFLYCSCVLRQSSLLFAVWSAKGWGPLAFTTMLQPGPRPFLPPTLTAGDRTNYLLLERLSTLTGISRSSIASCLGQLHGPWLLHLGQRERIAVLEVTASIYACIGYQRKEAYILREVLGCLLDLMVCGREEDGYTQTPNIPQSAGLGIHNVHPVAGVNWGTVGVRLSESTAGNESILKLLAYICRVLGIDLEAIGLSEATEARVVEHPPSLNKYDEDIVDELREPLGWPELQVGVVREAVAVAEALPDFPTVAQFALSSLKTLQTVLTPNDQYHLYATASRALLTSRRRGDPRAIEYWSGRPIVSISVAPLPTIRIPIEKPRSIRHKVLDPAPILQGIVDPFLYNPRRASDKGTSLVVQNEMLEFVITLQNPYIFDLELQEVSLSTSGVPFDSQPMRVVIPASTLHQVVISGKATETGVLTIRGCFVQAPGGIPREYILPLYTTEEEERLARKRRVILSESCRFKYPPLERHPWTQADKHKSIPNAEAAIGSAFKFLECKVVPEQPLLRIRRSSVTHGALMLYDGEKSIIRITLENVSSIPVDFLHLASEDSTIGPSQKALQEGNLSVFETYETEFNLIHRPVLTWDKDESKSIAPNQNLTLTLGCFGKVGCTNGVIHISYAYSQDPRLGDSGSFYLRQVSYPLMVTVYQMLECSAMDLLPFPAYPQVRRSADTESVNPKDERLRHLDISDDGWCLFSIEVRNSYGTPFDITLFRTQNGKEEASSTTTIPPGLVIPIRKIVLSDEAVSKIIPTLSEKQFVVATSNLTKVEEKAQRELFWYREELFKCVSARWHETGGTRSGELSFRAQRLTLPMLETFRLEIAQVSLSLEREDNEEEEREISYTGAKQYLKPNEFVQLRAKVMNLCSFPVVFTLDLEATPSEHLIYEGIFSELAIGRLQSGESKEISTTLCFLACGRFELSAKARGFGSSETEGRVARTHISAIVTED